MRLAILALGLAGPAWAQTQTLTVPIDWGFASVNSASISGGSPDPLRLDPPLVPGRITGMSFTFQVEMSGLVQVTNPYASPRIGRGRPMGSTWRSFSGSIFNPGPRGGWFPYQWETGIIDPFESETIAVSASYSVTESGPWTQGQLDDPMFFGYERVTTTKIPDWYICNPLSQGPGGCLEVWGDPNYVLYHFIDFSITGSITYEWEPDLPSVIDVCPGDGYERIGLVGDWQGEVTAYSTYYPNFTMLFMGGYFDNPNSSFCIGSGQRINESLRWGGIEHTFAPGTLLTGQTYTMQAVHRFGTEVRFSNAILFQPL